MEIDYVVRGGAFYNYARLVYGNTRNGYFPYVRDDAIGFRLVKDNTRMLRGGSFAGAKFSARMCSRGSGHPCFRYEICGFRVVRNG